MIRSVISCYNKCLDYYSLLHVVFMENILAHSHSGICLLYKANIPVKVVIGVIFHYYSFTTGFNYGKINVYNIKLWEIVIFQVCPQLFNLDYYLCLSVKRPLLSWEHATIEIYGSHGCPKPQNHCDTLVLSLSGKHMHGSGRRYAYYKN